MIKAKGEKDAGQRTPGDGAIRKDRQFLDRRLRRPRACVLKAEAWLGY
jgi:hypothetical protein